MIIEKALRLSSQGFYKYIKSAEETNPMSVHLPA